MLPEAPRRSISVKGINFTRSPRYAFYSSLIPGLLQWLKSFTSPPPLLSIGVLFDLRRSTNPPSGWLQRFVIAWPGVMCRFVALRRLRSPFVNKDGTSANSLSISWRVNGKKSAVCWYLSNEPSRDKSTVVLPCCELEQMPAWWNNIKCVQTKSNK